MCHGSGLSHGTRGSACVIVTTVTMTATNTVTAVSPPRVTCRFRVAGPPALGLVTEPDPESRARAENEPNHRTHRSRLEA